MNPTTNGKSNRVKSILLKKCHYNVHYCRVNNKEENICHHYDVLDCRINDKENKIDDFDIFSNTKFLIGFSLSISHRRYSSFTTFSSSSTASSSSMEEKGKCRSPSHVPPRNFFLAEQKKKHMVIVVHRIGRLSKIYEPPIKKYM